MTIKSSVLRRYTIAGIAKSGHRCDHNLSIPQGFAQQWKQWIAIHTRQADIGKDQLRLEIDRLAQSGLRVGRGAYIVVEACELFGRRLIGVFVIVDKKYAEF